MYRKKPEKQVSHLLFTLFLFSLLFVVFLSVGLGSPGHQYDYVDNNISDVDGSPDLGNHSNFTAQQYGPDLIYDVLTEGTNVSGIVYENSMESYSTTGQTSHNFAYSLQKGSGNNRLVVLTVSWEDAQAAASVASLTFDGTPLIKAADITVGTGYSEYISLWYLLDSSLPGSSGSYTVAVTASESITREIYVALAEYSGVKQSAPDDSATHGDTGGGNTAVTLTAAADGSLVVAGVGEGGTNILTNTNNINNLQEQVLTSSGSALGHHINVNSGSITVGWNNLGTRRGMAGAVWQPAINYKLDLEVQWTNATFTDVHEELCIYGGTMGSENIVVDVWTGASWQNLFTDLSGGWNNISVTDYLTSSTFTIRFKGSVETDDSSQDSWSIDCTLLHTWGENPIANFSYSPLNPYTGDTVTFNASNSYDPDGTITIYNWNFGDGSNGTGIITTHSYADSGTFSVILTVTDNDELSDSMTTNITVLNRVPVASFSESAVSVLTGESISFNASSSFDLDGSIVSFWWDFGDGSNSSGVTVSHSYVGDGVYTVTLTVTDDDGASDSVQSTKTVLNRAPVASFTESATTVFTNDVISFNASSSYDLDGVIVSFFWDFGDGSNSSGVVVSHSYVGDGVYTVTLTVTDDDGATDSV
ncbi:MAG: PKD domain-containing protein, partial [Candidatus Bathyarchaeota archaeon]